MNKPQPGTELAGSARISSLLAIVFAVLFAALGYLPENLLWGLNHLFFYPGRVKIILAAAALFVLLPFWQPLSQSVSRRLSTSSLWWRYLLLAVAFGILFTVLRTRVHSLGDGYQRASEILDGWLYSQSEMLDFFFHAMVYRFLNLFGSVHSIVAYAVTSIAAGIGCILILFRESFKIKQISTLAVVAIITLGSSQLFFGYVESYTLVYLLTIWYLLLIMRDEEKQAPFLVIGVSFLLAAFSHQVAVILLPSYLYVAHRRFAGHPKRWMILGIVLLTAAVPFVLPVYLTKTLHRVFSGTFLSHFMPLVGGEYPILALRHFLDIANEFVLIGLPAILLLPLLRFKNIDRRRKILFALLVLPAALFILIFDPKLSFSRDWDLFSIPTIVCCIPVILFVLPPARFARTARVPVLRVIAVAAVVTSTWVIMNATPAIHLVRAEYLLDHATQGRWYGYESLAHYFHLNNQPQQVINLLEKIPPEHRASRIYGKLAFVQYQLKRIDEAYANAMKGLEFKDPASLNYLIAGVTSLMKDSVLNAIKYLREALNKGQDDLTTYDYLAVAFLRADSIDMAGYAFGAALKKDDSRPDPYFGLAQVFLRQGKLKEAERHCMKGLSISPNYSGGRELLEEIRRKMQEASQDSLSPPNEKK